MNCEVGPAGKRPKQVYTAFDTHLDGLGVYKLDTIGDAFVVVAGLDGFKSKEVRNLASLLSLLLKMSEVHNARNSRINKLILRVRQH